MQILKGHVSPETAYVVDDYPFGFRLRCKIRYWLEYKKGKGIRFVSQTTNPKVPGERWNKPKASTYARFGGCMFLNDEGHVRWAGLSEYSGGQEAATWKATYGEGMPPEAVPVLNGWVAAKVAYDEKRAAAKAEGQIPPLHVGLTEARKAFVEHVTAVKIEVFDERAHIPGNPSHVGTHENVPGTWTVADIIERLGIASHLTVYRTGQDGTRKVIRRGEDF